MLHELGCLAQQHDLRLVALAAFICAFASWTAVRLASRARVGTGWPRRLWILAAGAVFGTGIWATHFVSMLAYQGCLQIGYELLPTVLSVLIAVVLSTMGFAIVLRPGFAALGGIVTGIAVGAMHFTGMAAMEGPFDLRWNGVYVAASLIAGAGLATVGALLGVRIRNVRGRIGASALLALSVFGLHFTAMNAVTLIPDPHAFYDHIALAPEALAIAIAAAAVLIVALGLMAALLDNHLALRRGDEAVRLLAHVAELEKTQDNLAKALSEASAASAAKSVFLATMSHELRTPLNAVIGFSDLILDETFGPVGHPRYREYIADIHRSGAHLLAVINDVLDLSRLDAGEAVLREEDASLSVLLAEAMRLMAPQAGQAAVRLTQDIAQGLPRIRVDSRRIGQVFLNVLSNAIKFTHPGGGVHAMADEIAQGLRVRIVDTGIGIAPDDVARAFERFGQVDSRLARKYEGTGLGLPLAKELVALHSGTLSLQSVPGTGTTVTILLPASRIMRAAAAA